MLMSIAGSKKGTYILILKAENEFDSDAKSHLFYF